MNKNRCADCGGTDKKVTSHDHGETQYGRFKIGFPLCNDCYIQTCRNFDEDYENGTPYLMFERV
jgi:hypothetical protein